VGARAGDWSDGVPPQTASLYDVRPALANLRTCFGGSYIDQDDIRFATRAALALLGAWRSWLTRAEETSDADYTRLSIVREEVPGAR
jgi:hypothetical protein